MFASDQAASGVKDRASRRAPEPRSGQNLGPLQTLLFQGARASRPSPRGQLPRVRRPGHLLRPLVFPLAGEQLLNPFPHFLRAQGHHHLGDRGALLSRERKHGFTVRNAPGGGGLGGRGDDGAEGLFLAVFGGSIWYQGWRPGSPTLIRCLPHLLSDLALGSSGNY